MSKVMTRRCSPMCRDKLITQIEILKKDFENYYHKFIENGVLYMNPITYEDLKREVKLEYNQSHNKIFNLEIRVDQNIEPFTFMIREEEKMELRVNGYNPFRANNNLPKRYIINKGATILFWEDGTKTIVKRSKDDEYNKRLGFLTSYFQKHSGLTKNQANKYLANLQDEEELANAK